MSPPSARPSSRQFLAPFVDDSPSDCPNRTPVIGVPLAPLLEPVEEGADLSVHVRGVGEHSGAERFDSPSSQLPDCPEGARLIPLTRGYFAIVDEADYERVAQFKWHARVNGRKTPRPYGARANGPGVTFLHHEIIGRPPAALVVDHINGDSLDNRRSNLRFCTQAENARNARPYAIAAVSFRGVSIARNKYRAIIRCNGRNHSLGCFGTPEEAARAYDTAAKQFHGPFARLNFPDESAVVHATYDDCGSDQWRASGRVGGLPRW